MVGVVAEQIAWGVDSEGGAHMLANSYGATGSHTGKNSLLYHKVAQNLQKGLFKAFFFLKLSHSLKFLWWDTSTIHIWADNHRGVGL